MSRNRSRIPRRRYTWPKAAVVMTVMGWGLLLLVCTEAAQSSSSSSGTNTTRSRSTATGTTDESSTSVTRVGNLDYLDAATMAYYLDAPRWTADHPEHDVVVLFYAQWCRNCHAFAPLYDQMSKLLHAGTKDSQLVMGLFDCEQDKAHSRVCSDAGVTHYPTIMFLSSSGQVLQRGRRSPKVPLPKHITTFRGNWQYGDAVMDWIKTLRGLSHWHRAGWGKTLRNLLFGRRHRDPARERLPTGIPSGTNRRDGTTTAGNGATHASHEQQELRDEIRSLSDLVIRSSTIVDALLFPVTAAANKTLSTNVIRDENAKNYTDVFAFLRDAWHSNRTSHQVIRTCAMEVALDYCGRLNTHVTEDWLTAFPSIDRITEADLNLFRNELPKLVAKQEPYCAVVEDCIVGDFAEEHCRPAACPFVDPAACRYLTCCLTEQVYEEYAVAMDLVENVTAGTSANIDAADKDTPSNPKSGSGGAWGFQS